MVRSAGPRRRGIDGEGLAASPSSSAMWAAPMAVGTQHDLVERGPRSATRTPRSNRRRRPQPTPGPPLGAVTVTGSPGSGARARRPTPAPAASAQPAARRIDRGARRPDHVDLLHHQAEGRPACGPKSAIPGVRSHPERRRCRRPGSRRPPGAAWGRGGWRPPVRGQRPAPARPCSVGQLAGPLPRTSTSRSLAPNAPPLADRRRRLAPGPAPGGVGLQVGRFHPGGAAGWRSHSPSGIGDRPADGRTVVRRPLDLVQCETPGLGQGLAHHPPPGGRRAQGHQGVGRSGVGREPAPTQGHLGPHPPAAGPPSSSARRAARPPDPAFGWKRRRHQRSRQPRPRRRRRTRPRLRGSSASRCTGTCGRAAPGRRPARRGEPWPRPPPAARRSRGCRTRTGCRRTQPANPTTDRRSRGRGPRSW